jgi:hypothetical protein
MALKIEIQKLLGKFVAAEIDYRELRGQFAALCQSIEDSGEPEAIRLSYAVESELADFSEDLISPEELKRRLVLIAQRRSGTASAEGAGVQGKRHLRDAGPQGPTRSGI